MSLRKPLTAALVALAGAGALLAGSATAAVELPAISEFPDPALVVSGQEIAADVAAFSTAFPERITGSPVERLAGDDLVRRAEAIGGWKVTTVAPPLSRTAGGQTVTTPSDLPAGAIEAIVLRKEGTGDNKDETIVFGGHYDGFPGAQQAAYDNGTGTMLLLGMAKALKAVGTDRALEIHLYNGEEEGAFASDAMAKLYKSQGRKIAAYLGFDMVGIAFPVAAPAAGKTCLCMWWGTRGTAGAEDKAIFNSIMKHVNFDAEKGLGLPNVAGRVEIVGVNTRNSDERSWATQGYPTARWAGLRTASTYPQYHLPLDNMETILTQTGSLANFEAGLMNTLKSAYYTALVLDRTTP